MREVRSLGSKGINSILGDYYKYLLQINLTDIIYKFFDRHKQLELLRKA